MSKPKSIFIKESQIELNKILKTANPIFIPRIRMLIEQLRHVETGISKRELAKLIGVNPNSIQKWRATYEREGLDGLLKHGKIGFKPSVVTKEEHASLQLILNDPENGLQGYKELKRWFEEKHSKSIPYTTLVGYCIRHFKTKIKVARKSHVKKDEKEVDTFKKTLVAN